jgi:putative RecB family exonuclease
VSGVFSHSRLSSFESCPKKFQFRYVLRVPSDSESIEQFVGKRVHEVLERLYIAVGKGLVPSLSQVLRRFQLLWDGSYDAERVRVARPENSVASYRGLGERGLSNYYRRFYPFDGGETLDVERRVTFDLDDRGAYRMQGVIDRIARAPDEAIEIHDYKTSRRMPSQEKLDRDRQLALYQIGVARIYGAERPIRLVWHYLLLDRIATSTRTPEQLDDLRAHTMGLIDRIREETAFEARTGPLCGWCEYRDICPAVWGSADAEPIANANHAAIEAPSTAPRDASLPSDPAPATAQLRLPLA